MKGFTTYKGRSIREGQQVKVYRNLHKDMYSVADAKTGKVLGYCEEVTLFMASFIVQQGGRERVLREKKKNVHAFIIGTFAGTTGEPKKHEAYYNPYRTKTFVRRNPSGDLCGALENAAIVALNKNGITYEGSY